MAYTILISCCLLATLQVINCDIDTSHYKILIDRKEGNFDYWNKKCNGKPSFDHVVLTLGNNSFSENEKDINEIN